MTTMTRAEREDLQRLVRQREKLLKLAAKQRSAELLADFENQMGQIYSFDQDEVWKAAKEAAKREVAKAEKAVAARCRELGIPERFAPGMDICWWSRGENAVTSRRVELRKMATTKIAAMEAEALTQIVRSSLEAQTELAMTGLSSDAARGFVERLPPIESLMPQLSFAEVAGKADPPVAERLVSSNALRQQRFRERQKALRKPDVTLPSPESNADDESRDESPPCQQGKDKTS
ncbi:MAG TPA: hypothetical protein VIF88_03930 [Methylocystis sp.]